MPRTAIKKPRVVKKKQEAKQEAVEHTLASAVQAQTKPKRLAKISSQTVYAVGRRKTAVAQVLVSSGSGIITVNKLPLERYFMTYDLQKIAQSPLQALGFEKTMDIKGKVHGGGIHAQAESMRHAIARALIRLNPENRPVLKKQGMLTRDPRVKERKKPGLKRARRAPQFSKR